MKHLGANNIHSKPTSKVGFVLKTHGYSGHLRVEFHENDFDLKDFILFLINDKFVPFRIESFNKNSGILKLKDFDSVDAVTQFLSLPIVELIDVVDSSLPNFIGYNLHDSISGLEYPILNVIDMPGQTLLEFRCQYKDVLLPFHEDIISEINHDSKIIYATFPDGILDL
ncbi:MAG: hypothetical protein IT245_07280 [Bacteroidia bacterium]|nr:hypothetical protein [Bacteroidia bacterium]